MRKVACIKLLCQMLLLCSTNILAENLLHLLGYSFCGEFHILVHFCQMVLSLKASKIICAKAALLCP
jgi:hypothetical protein